MTCKNCKLKPVIKLTNTKITLCRTCFNKYFEKKVRKTIRVHKLIDKKDKIGIAVSGGKDSMSLLYILLKVFEHRKKDFIVIAVDEGIKGYRNLDPLKKFCKINKIKLKIYSFEKEFGKSLDKIMKTKKEKPCSVCGVLRRSILNKKSEELELTKLATGHNLDDEAQTIIMNQFRKNIHASARLGPITGVIENKKFIKRIKPFYFLTEKEVATFAFLNNLIDKFNECPFSVDSYRADIRDMLNNFEQKYSGTKHSIINSFMEILPTLKRIYKIKRIKECKVCLEPCSQEICQKCNVIEKIQKK